MERIYVEIGNICNLRCSFCPSTTRSPRQMTVAELRQISAEVKKHTKYVYLHVMGEPLLHPQLEEFLAILREDGLRVCVTTNGTLLRKRGAILLESRAMHKISISLHAPEANTGICLADYLSDCVDFARRSAEQGIFTVFRLWNLDSEEGQGANSDNRFIRDFLKTSFPEEWIPRRNGYRLSTRIFLEYDGLFTWPAESKAEARDCGSCHGLRDQIAILADGTVVPCCLDSEGIIRLGNLFETPLEEILDRPRVVAMRKGFEEKRLVEPLCQSCTFARRFR